MANPLTTSPQNNQDPNVQRNAARAAQVAAAQQQQAMDPNAPAAGSTAQSAAASPAPQAAAIQAGAPQGGTPPSGGGNGSSPLPAQNVRYNPANANVSFMNALMDSGYKNFAGNPGLSMLMNAAPGLADSYYINGAMSGNNPANMSEDFGTYLKNAISSGGIYNQLSQAKANMPGAIDKVRQAQNGDPNAAISNPLLAALATQFGQSGGLGSLQDMLDIQDPTWNSDVTSGMKNAMFGTGGLAFQATRNWSDPSNFPNANGDPTHDLYYYLYGR